MCNLTIINLNFDANTNILLTFCCSKVYIFNKDFKNFDIYLLEYTNKDRIYVVFKLTASLLL